MSNNGAAAATQIALLTFRLDAQEYGLSVTDVVRIIEMVTITTVPGLPAAIRGLINVHGKAIPVIDMRQRFGMPAQPYGLHTPIILVEGADETPIGLIVDEVLAVRHVMTHRLEIAESVIPPDFLAQTTIPTGFLTGVAKVERKIILVLNARALLSTTEHEKLTASLAGA